MRHVFKSRGKSRHCLLLLGSAIGALAPLASADTSATWDGTYNDWSSAAHWSTNPYYPNNGTPAGTTYDATINSGQPTLDVSVTINDLTLAGGAGLQTNSGQTLTAAQLNDSGSIVFISDNILDITGSATDSGNLYLGGGSTATFSSLSVGGSLSSGYGGSSLTTVTGELSNSGNITLSNSGGLLDVNSFSNQGYLTINPGATLNITGGGPGLTDIPAGSQIVLYGGAFDVINNGVGTSALANLSTLEGSLFLLSGETYTFGPLTTSNTIAVGSGTEVTVNGNIISSDQFDTGYSGGGNTVNVNGTFTNTGSLTVGGAGDVVNIKALNNLNTVTVDAATTLNLTGGGPGVTDIPGGTVFVLYTNAFNVINNGVSTSALANLATVEGQLYLLGQTSYSLASVNTSNNLEIGEGAAASFYGNVTNSGTFGTGYGGGGNTLNIAGTLTNTGTFNELGAGDLVNVKSLNNLGQLRLNAGAVFNITGGGPGLTTIPSSAQYDFYGNDFNVINNGVPTSGLVNLSTIAGNLYLISGTTFSLGPLTNTGLLSVGQGTTVNIAGNLTNNSNFSTGYGGGNNTVNISGTLINTDTLTVGNAGDIVNAAALDNQAYVSVDAGATLNITGGGPGLTDIPAGTQIALYSNGFNVINHGVATSALANLSTIEGTLYLLSGETFSLGSLTNTGSLQLGQGTTLNIAGNLATSDTFDTGDGSGDNTVNITGTLTNTGSLSLNASGDTVNAAALSNQGYLGLTTGTTFNITGGGAGVTDIPAGSQIDLYSNDFNVINNGAATSALANLSTIEGVLALVSGKSFTLGSISNSGSLDLGLGTTLNVNGNLNNSGGFLTGDSGGGNTLDVSGTFTNLGNFTMAATGDLANVNTLNNQGDMTIQPGATLNVTGGATTTYAPGNSVNISGTLTTSGSALIGGSLMVYNGGELNLTGGTTTVDALSIASGGIVNAGGTLVINYLASGSDPIATILSYLDAGDNGGKWNGTDIISTAVSSLNASQSKIIYAVGYSDSADGLDGLPSGEIEIMPTLAGDAKLQGDVVFGDFQVLAQYFGKTGTSWDEGNFTYGTSTDFGDFQELAQDFGANSSALTAGEVASINSFAAQFGDELLPNSDGVGFQVVSVPEPAAISLLALSSAGLLSRRNRKSDKIARPWASKSKPR